MILFLNCGLRLSELVSINIGPAPGQHSVVRGKVQRKGPSTLLIPYLKPSTITMVDPSRTKVADALFSAKGKTESAPKPLSIL